MNFLRSTRRFWAAALAILVAGAVPAQAGFFGGQTPTYNIPIPGTNSGGETPTPDPTPTPIPDPVPNPNPDPPGEPPPPVVDPPPPVVDPPPTNETPEPATVLMGLTAVGLTGAYRLRRRK